MKPVLIASSLLALTLMGQGCVSQNQTQTASTSTSATSTMDHMNHQAMMKAYDGKSKLASVGDVVFSQEVYSPGALTLSFKVVGEDGKAYKPETLETVHEQKMHVILVRRDLKVFRHEHPTYTPNGYWTLKTNIADPGDYFMYIDIVPTLDPAVVWRLPFRIRGTWTEAAPENTPGMTTTVNGVEAKLQTSKVFRAGQAVTLDVALTKDGKALPDIQPYLGAFGHLVVTRYKMPEIFLHSHPLTDKQPKDGHVKFETTFPEAGRYTMFAQFNVTGTVMVFPFTLDVTK